MSAEISTAGSCRCSPPVRRPRVGRDVAGLVHDRHRAGARVLGDLAGNHVDHRRAVAVAVPGHDTARLHLELAQAELGRPPCTFSFDRSSSRENGSVTSLGSVGPMGWPLPSATILSAGHSPAMAVEAVAMPAAETMAAMATLRHGSRNLVNVLETPLKRAQESAPDGRRIVDRASLRKCRRSMGSIIRWHRAGPDRPEIPGNGRVRRC